MNKGILINPNTGAKVVDFEPHLEWFYEHLECQLIDIAERKVCGEYVDFICDDEGLLKDEIIPSAVDWDGHVQLVGSVLVCKHNGNGEEEGLDDGLINNIMEQVGTTKWNDKKIHILCGVEY